MRSTNQAKVATSHPALAIEKVCAVSLLARACLLVCPGHSSVFYTDVSKTAHF
jgi:hypothetical protein